MRDRTPVEKRFAEFYRLYAAAFRQDLPIYLDLAAKYEGPVLDVGCGTGRITARLAQAGYEVHGIDISRPMLEQARDYLRPWQERVRLYDFDLRHQALSERFSVALVPLFTFNRLIDVEEQRLFLRHLRRSMKSPGVIAIDLFCPLSLVRPSTLGQWRELERTRKGRHLRLRDHRESRPRDR